MPHTAAVDPAPGGRFHHLHTDDVSMLLHIDDDDVQIVHWGARLPDALPDPGMLAPGRPHSSFDAPVRRGALAQPSHGWRGRPGLRVGRAGRALFPLLHPREVEATSTGCTVWLTDDGAGVRLGLRWRLVPSGLLLCEATVVNTGDDDLAVAGVDLTLPVPPAAAEMLDLTGRWAGERRPQRQAVRQGTWTRTGRHGRTGHDAPLLVAAGTPGFGFRRGEVWATHLGWSGNHESFLERTPDGTTVLGAGELLADGEIVLHPGERHDTPTLYAAWSAEGLDGVAWRFHGWMRSRPQHPQTPRPVTLNTWEAVYFRHDPRALAELADRAAELGVERFVLDDGWFHARRRDTAGLGDWTVDTDVWPDGLGPLAAHVHGLGMQFGLWVEPEMVNLDSDLARAHPDWVCTPRPGDARRPLASPWRHQYVLDLVDPDAWAWVHDRLDALVRDNAVDYLKWDQNRDDVELAHRGAPSAHAQTQAVYRMLDALRADHPGLEIESCSSGGGRVDLGILQHTDRIWASDTNDALERQDIQRWTQLVVPPELVGAHVGPPRSHTTGRTHDIGFRALTALVAHMGVEWDIRRAGAEELSRLREAVAFHKRHRGLLHTGVLVHADHPDPSRALYGVVDASGRHGVFVYAQLRASEFETPGMLRLPGLDPEVRYAVRLGLPVPAAARAGLSQPGWLAAGASATGAFLARVGLPGPFLNPESAVVIIVDAPAADDPGSAAEEAAAAAPVTAAAASAATPPAGRRTARAHRWSARRRR